MSLPPSFLVPGSAAPVHHLPSFECSEARNYNLGAEDIRLRGLTSATGVANDNVSSALMPGATIETVNATSLKRGTKLISILGIMTHFLISQTGVTVEMPHEWEFLPYDYRRQSEIVKKGLHFIVIGNQYGANKRIGLIAPSVFIRHAMDTIDHCNRVRMRCDEISFDVKREARLKFDILKEIYVHFPKMPSHEVYDALNQARAFNTFEANEGKYLYAAFRSRYIRAMAQAVVFLHAGRKLNVLASEDNDATEIIWSAICLGINADQPSDTKKIFAADSGWMSILQMIDGWRGTPYCQ